MGEDITIHVEAEVPKVETPPVVVVEATPEIPAEILSELEELRAEKAAREEQRLADIEADAAAALAIAELALNESHEEELEPVVVVEDDPVDTAPVEDSEPDNSHPFFKKW